MVCASEVLPDTASRWRLKGGQFNSQRKVCCVWLWIDRDTKTKQEGSERMVKVEGVEQRVGDDLLCEEISITREEVVVRQRIQSWARTALFLVLASTGVDVHKVVAFNLR